jgi:hypothetical protein
MHKLKWQILIILPLAVLAITWMALPGAAVAAPLLGITLTPTVEAPTATPVTPTAVPPTAGPPTATPTGIVVPPNQTATPTSQATAAPTEEEEEEEAPVRVTPSLPETGETPPGPPWQRLDWLGILAAALVALVGTLVYRRITHSKRGS